MISVYTPELDIKPIRAVDARLTGGLPDDELIRELRARGIEGLITNDDSMLALPEVLQAIQATRITVVACRGTGHDPLVATGLLLTHLSRIARRHVPNRHQVWVLSAPDRGPVDFAKLLATAQGRQ